jgi:CHAD domain-containing protein
VVESFPHDFVLASDGRPPADVVRAALAPRLRVAPDGRPRTLRLTWLDTFDWRLHAAGLTLQHSVGSRVSDYMLTGDDGERVTATARGLRWPALAGALPPGPLRARLQPVTAVRALMPIARATATVRQMRVLNADDKTIVWLTITGMSLAGQDGSDLAPRLSVAAVRGYQAQAGRIARCLAAAAGVTPAVASPLDDVLAATGRHPGDYSSKVDVKLTAEMPARCALEEVLLRLLDTLEANVPGTIREIDTEFLRPARRRPPPGRRSSCAATCCYRCARGVQRRVQMAGRRIHPDPRPRRLPAQLRRMAAGLLAATFGELEPFHQHLARSREAEQRELVRALRSRRFLDLIKAWRKELAAPAPRRGITAAALAADRIRRASQKVLKRGAAITPDSPPESLHDLRKRCKELRYLLEFFASLHDPAIHQQAVRDLKGLQDCLGEYQDCQVQQHEIRMFAAQMMTEPDVPATALLAMGELASKIARRERRARREFAAQFADFASPASQHRFRALTSGAGR